VLSASPSSKFAHAIDTVERIPYLARWRRGHASIADPARPIRHARQFITGQVVEEDKASRSTAPEPAHVRRRNTSMTP